MIETDQHGRYVIGVRYAFNTQEQAHAFFEQFAEVNVAEGYGQVLEAWGEGAHCKWPIVFETPDNDGSKRIDALEARVQSLEATAGSEEAEPALNELAAAADFTNALIPRADVYTREGYPAWHGWALTDAFIAGITFGKDNR